MRATAILFCLELALCVPCGTAASQSPPPVRITRDSLGALSLREPLAAILQRVPNATRTAWRGHEIGYPALAFRIGSLRIWAVQELEPAEGSDTIPDLDLTKPADFFAIEGKGGILSTGGLTGGTWGQLRRTLGRVLTFAEPGLPIHVRPCRYPWLTIGFANRTKPARRKATKAAPSVPVSARPAYFHLRPAERGEVPDPRCSGA